MTRDAGQAALAGTRVLVTGAAGMIGANLTHRLVSEGAEVAVLLRPGTNGIRLEPVQHAVEVHEADLTQAETVRAIIMGIKPEVVFHLASTIWGKQPPVNNEMHVRVNILGTVHVLEALRSIPTARIVFTDSCAAYGEGSKLEEGMRPTPGTIYGASKASATIFMQTYARLYGLRSITLRLFMPYGPWEHPARLIPHTILSALAGRDVPMTLGHQQRDPIYIDDVVDALLLAATKRVAPGSLFNIGSGVGVPVKDVVGLILRLMGHPVKPLLGAVPMRPDEILTLSADIGSAKTVLGWRPRTSLEDGLRKSIAWFTEHRELVSRLAQRQSESVRDTVGAPP